MSSETPSALESLWARSVSSTTSCLLKAKLFTGRILGSDEKKGDEKGEEGTSKLRIGLRMQRKLATHIHSPIESWHFHALPSLWSNSSRPHRRPVRTMLSEAADF